jgi:hypothetical protein
MTQTESLVLEIEQPAISWQAVSPTSLDGPFLHEATGRYVPTERAQALPIALQQPSTRPASSTDTAPCFAEARAQGRFGVVLVGIAQEKDSAWRDGGPDGHPHFEFARQSVFPNFSHFYLYEAQLGPAFVKVTTYVPISMWVGGNGQEWAKRQAESLEPGGSSTTLSTTSSQRQGLRLEI